MKYDAKIKTAEYNEDRDILIWTLLNKETGKEQSYAWSSQDYLKNVIGIDVAEDVPIKCEPEVLHIHCKDMIGKEFMFEVRGTPQVLEQKFSKDRIHEVYHDIKDKDIEEAEKHMNNFCDNILDVKKKIEEGGIDL